MAEVADRVARGLVRWLDARAALHTLPPPSTGWKRWKNFFARTRSVISTIAVSGWAYGVGPSSSACAPPPASQRFIISFAAGPGSLGSPSAAFVAMGSATAADSGTAAIASGFGFGADALAGSLVAAAPAPATASTAPAEPAATEATAATPDASVRLAASAALVAAALVAAAPAAAVLAAVVPADAVPAAAVPADAVSTAAVLTAKAAVPATAPAASAPAATVPAPTVPAASLDLASGFGGLAATAAFAGLPGGFLPPPAFNLPARKALRHSQRRAPA